MNGLEQNNDRISIRRHFNMCHVLAQLPFESDAELYDTVQICLGLRISEVQSMGNLKGYTLGLYIG
jgi:hypothetical protein